MDEQQIRRDDDILTHLGDEYDLYQGAVIPPIFVNTLHVTPKEDIGTGKPRKFAYGRVSNPTTDLFERKVAALERGERALAFGSGMAAISSAILSAVKSGDHVLAVTNVYGPTRVFLTEDLGKRFGVESTFIDGNDIAEFEAALRPNTTCIYLETPSSMRFTLQDLEAVAALARPRGIITIVDNSWATPLFQKPLTLGIDLSVHTVSKYMGGHSDVIAGVVSGFEPQMQKVHHIREFYGGILGPFESFLAIRGLRTLRVRLEEHQRAALRVAEFLEKHPKVSVVHYPGLPSHPQHELALRQMSGFSSPLSFELHTDTAGATEFVKRLQWFNVGPSWGGFESMVTLPQPGATLVRIHVGLENVETLMNDLRSSLDLIP